MTQHDDANAPQIGHNGGEPIVDDVAQQPAGVVRGVCPNCGDTVYEGGRGRGRTFCRPKCKTLFANRSKSEGAPMLPMVLAWIETRHAKPGTREADICRMARSELTAIARHTIEKRREDGMPPAADYVEALFATGDRFMDRTPRR